MPYQYHQFYLALSTVQPFAGMQASILWQSATMRHKEPATLLTLVNKHLPDTDSHALPLCRHDVCRVGTMATNGFQHVAVFGSLRA